MRNLRRTPPLVLALAFAAGCAGEPPAAEPKPDAPAKAPEQKAPVADAPQAQDPPEGDTRPQGPPPGPDTIDPRLGDFAQERSLQEQERKALAENYYQTGKNLFQQVRHREAAANLERAVALDPDHIEARKLRDRVLWILGDRRAEHRDAVRVMVEERLAKIDQARTEIERLQREAKMLMEKKRFDAAEERFQRVLEAIRWFPYDIDRSGIRKEAEELIVDARRLGEEQERRRLQMLQEAARQAAEHEKANTRRFKESTIRSLLRDAKEALRVSKFQKCIRLCDDVLRQQPNNADAEWLRRDAVSEEDREESLEIYRARVENWRRQFEWVESAAVPYQQIFQFPDREQWAEIAARNLPIAEELRRRKESEDTLEIRSRLESQQVSLNFDQTPFNEAVDFLREITGLNYVVSREAQDLIDGESVEVSLRLKNISLQNALNLILAAHEDLTWKIANGGVIKIGTEEGEVEDLVLDFYDVNEIVQVPPDFPAPELGLNLASSGGGGGGAAGGVLSFDDEEEETSGKFEPDKLIELIESKLGEDEEEGSVEYSAGILIVRKPLSAHEKILKLLDALRKTVGIMVTVESRFIQIQNNVLEHLGVDIINQNQTGAAPLDSFGQIVGVRPGAAPMQVGYNFTDAQGQQNYRAGIVNTLSSTAPAGLPFNISPQGGIALQYNFLDDFQLQALLEAVKKKQKGRVINAPRLTVFNGQRSHILNVRQRAFIQDVEVNQTGVIPVLNPVIGILNTGAILEVRPTVSHDRRYISMEVKPTLAAELPARIPAPVTLANAFTSIPIELPVITIQKLRSSVTVPDGGTVLLGGLKNFDEFEGESGVPLLLRLPLLNNLFRRQAFHKLQASLVVLLKADITIIREEEHKIFGRD